MEHCDSLNFVVRDQLKIDVGGLNFKCQMSNFSTSAAVVEWYILHLETDACNTEIFFTLDWGHFNKREHCLVQGIQSSQHVAFYHTKAKGTLLFIDA